MYDLESLINSVDVYNPKSEYTVQPLSVMGLTPYINKSITIQAVKVKSDQSCDGCWFANKSICLPCTQSINTDIEVEYFDNLIWVEKKPVSRIKVMIEFVISDPAATCVPETIAEAFIRGGEETVDMGVPDYRTSSRSRK